MVDPWARRRSELVGEKMTVPLVLAKRSALEREVVQQRVSRAAHQDLDRAVPVDSAVALPDMPSPRDDLLDGGVVELDGDGNLVGLWSTGSAPT
jgi:hypothetical protein